MIKNYLKIAFRNLLKNKTHSVINITGLSVGMAVAMLIGLWIWDEISFNESFQNHDRIVQVMQHLTYNGEVKTQDSNPLPLDAVLRDNYKNDFKYVVISSWTDEHILSSGDDKLTQLGSYMQPEATDMLSLKMLEGSRTALNDPSGIILSSSTAKALFGSADPMNRLMKIDNKWNVKVTGVYEDMPYNSTFKSLSFIAPWDLYMSTEPYLKHAAADWGNNSWQIYAQLNPGIDINKAAADIKDLKKKAFELQNDKASLAYKPAFFLHPMNRWHLYSEFKNGVNTGGEIQFVWMFAIIGIFVLLLACINFMNLSTARSEKRAKEVGIRKTLGSMRQQLIGQFFSESLIMAFMAFLVALLLAQLTLSWFNQLADKQMSVLWGNPLFWLLGVGFSLITGLIAGIYPAIYLSSFKPVKVLKGTFKAGRSAAIPRKVLVVLQFTFSVTLIIGTIIVFRQVQFTKNRPVGYSREGLIEAQMKTNDIHAHFDAVKNDLLQSGAVSDIAESGSPLTHIWSNSSGLKWKDKPPGLQDDFGMIPITSDYGKTVGWKLTDGRDLSRDFMSDSSAMIANEAAIKFMNLKHPVGETIVWGKNYKIVGIVRDMIMTSPYNPVKPTLFYLIDHPGEIVNIRINPKMPVQDALSKIEAVFKQYDPESPFDYKFIDAEYAKKFAAEERIGKLAAFFTFLAIFISCMGLFGMASFMAEQRIKEIGVRKVLGATVFNLWRLMSTEFVVLVSISLIIAIPIAYYFMHSWLQNYNYRTELSWWIFAVTAVGAITITMLTVSFQSIKAALANPVNSLRSE